MVSNFLIRPGKFLQGTRPVLFWLVDQWDFEPRALLSFQHPIAQNPRAIEKQQTVPSDASVCGSH